MKLNKMKAAVAAGAAVVTMLVATPAFALTVVNVNGTATPAGPVVFAGTLSPGPFWLLLTDFAVPANCLSGTVDGYIIRGASLADKTKVGAITDTNLSSCTETGLYYPVVMEKSASAEWPIHLVGAVGKGSASAAVEIRNFDLRVHSTGSPAWLCDLKASGTLPARIYQGANPTIRIAPATGVFPLALQAYNGSGTKVPAATTCGGQIYTGDNAQMDATITLNTPVSW